MNYLFPTSNEIPILSLVISIVLIFGMYEIGKIIITNTFLIKLIKPISEIKFQSLIIGVNFIILVSFPILLFLHNLSKYYIILLTYLIFFLGTYKIIVKVKNLNINKLNLIYDYKTLLVLVSIFSYLLISTAPITSADSLDYHLFASKFIVENGQYPNYLNHFHSKLAGAGEIPIVIGLIAGTEQLNSIIQFFGIISILGIVKKNNNNNIFYYLILGSPVLLFFVSSIKPQLFYVASTSLVFSLLFFSKPNNQNILLKKYIFCYSLLAISTQVKFSFMLSYVIIGAYILYEAYKNKIFFRTFIAACLVYLIILIPPIIWKIYSYETTFLSLIINPFPIDRPGLDSFYNYLINAGRSKDVILGIIFPDTIGTITNSLGIGVFAYVVLFRKFKLNLFPIIIITVFIVIGYLKGQPASRFFLEPFIWTIIVLSKNKMEKLIPKIFSFAIILQYLIVLPAIFYGAFNLFQGNLTNDLRDKVMKKNASGYSLFKWANQELNKMNYNGPIISMHRSIGFSKNLTISSDVFWLTMLKEEKYIDYLKEIKELNPKYLLSYGKDIGNINHALFVNCDLKLIKKKEAVGINASRKPFGRGQKYNGYLFEINVNKFPHCLSYD